MAEEEFQIKQGMDVVDSDGKTIGGLDSILSEDRTGKSRFIIVNKKLLPVEAIDGVEGERLKMAFPETKLGDFPERRGDEIPDENMQRQAYQAIDLTGPVE